MRAWTFRTVSSGWLQASLISVDKKFLHFFTFSIIALSRRWENSNLMKDILKNEWNTTTKLNDNRK